VHGTFVNRNHFATWLGLCLLCLVALFHEALAVRRRNPAYQLPVQREVRLERFLARAWPYLAGLILMTGALILTHSRGGFLATLAGGAVLLLALHHRRPIASTRTRAVLAATLAFTVATFFITSSVLLERFDQSTAGMEGRLQAFELTTEGIEDNPLMGFGYGTYADSFRLYRSERLEGFFDKAHNTYLENLFELGWPAALALFAGVAWIGLLCFRGVRHRRRDWVYPATGLAATVLVATHALVDFSLQIPATALTFSALSGAACAQAFSSRSG
jgi:O-antigen ligase